MSEGLFQVSVAAFSQIFSPLLLLDHFHETFKHKTAPNSRDEKKPIFTFFNQFVTSSMSQNIICSSFLC